MPEAASAKNKKNAEVDIIKQNLDVEIKLNELLLDCALLLAQQRKEKFESRGQVIEYAIEPCLSSYDIRLAESELKGEAAHAARVRAIDIISDSLWSLIDARVKAKETALKMLNSHFRNQKACYAKMAVDYKEIATADFQLFMDAAESNCPKVTKEIIDHLNKVEFSKEQIASTMAIIDVCAAALALKAVSVGARIPAHLAADCPGVEQKFAPIQSSKASSTSPIEDHK